MDVIVNKLNYILCFQLSERVAVSQGAGVAYSRLYKSFRMMLYNIGHFPLFNITSVIYFMPPMMFRRSKVEREQ